MTIRAERWHALQASIQECSECQRLCPDEVTNPISSGEIPDPPDTTSILFVGVAPTPEEGRNRGGHFYSASGDSLRRGLFGVLDEVFDTTLKAVNESDPDRATLGFLQAGFFFVHASKVRPRRKLAPPATVMRFCSLRHLVGEVDLLWPQAICFLGSTSASLAAAAVCGRKVGEDPIPAAIGTWRGPVAVAPQPVRGTNKKGKNRDRTSSVIQRLKSQMQIVQRRPS